MKHPDTSPKRFAALPQSFLLAGFLIVACTLMTPEVKAQIIHYAAPMPPTPSISSVTERPDPSPRQAGDLPELVWERYDYCPDGTGHFCTSPISDHDFGTIATGASGPHLMLMLSNVSNSVSATNLSVQAGVEFPFHPGVSNDCFTLNELSPGEYCIQRVKFAPTEPGPVTGALTVTSAEEAEASLPLRGTGGTDRLLYGQFRDWEMSLGGFTGIVNVIYASSTSLDLNAEAADDFLVEDPEGWTITRIGMEMINPSVTVVVDSFDVFIMQDDGGIPGDVAVCSAPDSKMHFYDLHEMRLELTLSAACELVPGHYWLRVHVHAYDPFEWGTYYWGLQVLWGSEGEPPGEPSIHLNPPVWRNPEEGWPGSNCPEWTPLYPPGCGFADVGDWMVVYGAVFWLVGDIGTVSNEETPNDIVQGLRHPSPNPVRETANFTLAVDRGQQVIVEVFDIMGRRVQTLYEGSLAANAIQSLSLDASRLPSGVYVIRALGEDFVDTRRVTVVH